MSQLIAEVTTIIESTFYTTANTQVQIELQAIVSDAINSYVNSLLRGGKTFYNAKQMRFINLLSGSTLRQIPILSINNHLLDVEDNITKSDLTVVEQIPLLIATAIGQAAYSYWNTDVNASGSTQKWTAYYQSNQAYNFANIPFWIAATVEGALVGYGANVMGLVEPTTAMVTNRMVSALAGALAVNIAMTALQVIPRLQPGGVVGANGTYSESCGFQYFAD